MTAIPYVLSGVVGHFYFLVNPFPLKLVCFWGKLQREYSVGFCSSSYFVCNLGGEEQKNF